MGKKGWNSDIEKLLEHPEIDFWLTKASDRDAWILSGQFGIFAAWEFIDNKILEVGRDAFKKAIMKNKTAIAKKLGDEGKAKAKSQ